MLACAIHTPRIAGVFSITSTLSAMQGESGNCNPWSQAKLLTTGFHYRVLNVCWLLFIVYCCLLLTNVCGLFQALSCIVSLKEAAVELNTASYSAIPTARWQQSIDLFSGLQRIWLQLDLQSHTIALQSQGKAMKWIWALTSLTCMRWNSICPDTACYNVLSNAGDNWRWVLTMLDGTPQPDNLSLNAAMSMCDQFDISVGQSLLKRYNESSTGESSSSIAMLWAIARLSVRDNVRVCNLLAQADFGQENLLLYPVLM